MIVAIGMMLCNGWAKDSVGWCWLDENGNMATNEWIEINGDKYYVDNNGYRVTGKKTINGKTYTFDSDGKLIP